MMEKEDGRKLPRPCSFNCNRKTWCSSLSNSRCYLSTAQDLPQHTARSCSSSPSYTHMALQTTSGTSIPFVWEYGGQSVPGMHGTIGALSLNLQNSLSFGRVRSLLCNPNGRVSQIQMMKEPETMMQMCWWTSRNLASKTALCLAGLPHPWGGQGGCGYSGLAKGACPCLCNCND